MKGIVVTTTNKVEIKDFDEPLFETVGRAVGGYIEVVHPRGLSDPFVMIVNEEGLLQELPLNLFGSMLYGTATHGIPIVGDLVLMKEGYRDGEPDIVGLDPEDIQFFMENLRKITILKGANPQWQS